MNQFKHVAVLMGGGSSEREVSLRSGKACADALERRGYRVTRIDVKRDIATVLEPEEQDRLERREAAVESGGAVRAAGHAREVTRRRKRAGDPRPHTGRATAAAARRRLSQPDPCPAQSARSLSVIL